MRYDENQMLEKLFTSKIRIRILSYLFFEKERGGIREIAKKTNSPVSSVKKEIDNLEKIGLLTKVDKKVEISKDNQWKEDLKNIFIKTDYINYPLKDIFNKNKKIDFAFVFGSFAKGEITQKSDVDLFIIGDLSQKDVIKDLRQIENKINREINPIIWEMDELKKNKSKSLIKDIKKNGILMIKGDKNELQKIIG